MDDNITDLTIGRARSDGPPSMHAGALAIAPKLSRLHRLVYDALQQVGPMTDREIIGVVNGTTNECFYDETIKPRRIELTTYIVPPQVVDSGVLKMDPVSGVDVIVWRLTTADERRAALARIGNPALYKLQQNVIRREKSLSAAKAALAAYETRLAKAMS